MVTVPLKSEINNNTIVTKVMAFVDLNGENRNIYQIITIIINIITTATKVKIKMKIKILVSCSILYHSRSCKKCLTVKEALIKLICFIKLSRIGLRR